MSSQRYHAHDPIKERHSVSVKVLRLSCPSLVAQYPIEKPSFDNESPTTAAMPASLAYRSAAEEDKSSDWPFILSPILNLPESFGSAYVGETFSCTLCANNDLLLPPVKNEDDGNNDDDDDDGGGGGGGGRNDKKKIRDVRIEAEMKTPGLSKAQKLHLGPVTAAAAAAAGGGGGGKEAEEAEKRQGVLPAGATLQKVVSFDLKEEGNHVLAVTVSYYEATETSGRTRTFRKLYQFICKPALVVRTKVGVLREQAPARPSSRRRRRRRRRRWVLEAQLENCSEETMQLDRVVMELEPGLTCRDCNWETTTTTTTTDSGGGSMLKPVVHPGEVEQLCFIVQEAPSERLGTERGVAGEDDEVQGGGSEEEEEEEKDGGAAGQASRVVFGVLGISWRGAMGNRGFLSTGKLGTRGVK